MARVSRPDAGLDGPGPDAGLDGPGPDAGLDGPGPDSSGEIVEAVQEHRPGRFDSFQQRHWWVGFPLAVAYKYFEDQGTYLAALITYYGFVSLFPLLLIFVSVLSFVLQGNTDLQQRLLHSALAQFPIVGTQINRNLHSVRGSTASLVVALLIAFYGGLGVAEALQNAMNRAWAVPRYRRPNPLRSRLRSLGALILLTLGVAVTTGLSGLATSAQAFGASFGLGDELRVAITAVSVVVNVGLFITAFRLLTAHPVTTRQVLPGAVLAAGGWQTLQSVGTYYVGHSLKGSSGAYGVFGVVLGLIAWVLVASIVVVVCTEVNAVLARQLWPRGALSMLSEKAVLTPVDRRAYQYYARNERYRGFVNVELDFDHRPTEKARDPEPHDPSGLGDADGVGEAGRAEGAEDGVGETGRP